MIDQKALERQTLIRLIRFEKSLDQLKTELSQVPWDSELEVEIQKQDLLIVLARFLEKKLTSQELEEWANLIEMRETIVASGEVNEVVFKLANPKLEGELTLERAKAYYELLEGETGNSTS